MELRLVKHVELHLTVKLADTTLREHEQPSMFHAFPLIFDVDEIHSVGAFDGKRLVSFMGLVPFVIKVKLREVAFEQSTSELGRLIGAGAYAGCLKLEHRVLIATRGDGGIEVFVIIGAPGQYTANSIPLAIEWGGLAKTVAALFGEAVKRLDLPQLQIVVGWHEKKLIELMLAVLLPNDTNHNSGTIYIVNLKRLLDQAVPYLASVAETADLTLNLELCQDGMYQLDLSKGSI